MKEGRIPSDTTPSFPGLDAREGDVGAERVAELHGPEPVELEEAVEVAAPADLREPRWAVAFIVWNGSPCLEKTPHACDIEHKHMTSAKFTSFLAPIPCQYKIHVTSLPLVRNGPTPISADVICTGPLMSSQGQDSKKPPPPVKCWRITYPRRLGGGTVEAEPPHSSTKFSSYIHRQRSDVNAEFMS